MKNNFFKPHKGKNHSNNLLLLSTQWCPHTECKLYQKCVVDARSKECERECEYPNYMDGFEATSMSLLYQLELFFDNLYDEYGEEKNRTFRKIVNAINTALSTSMSEREVFDLFMCTESAQHFTRQQRSHKHDFVTADFDALLEFIEQESVNTVMICGTPSYEFIKYTAEERGLKWQSFDASSYFHRLEVGGRSVNIIYMYHPTALAYSDNVEDKEKHETVQANLQALRVFLGVEDFDEVAVTAEK